MKICLFITGSSGSGMTTLTRRLGLKGWATVHVGHMGSNNRETAKRVIHKALSEANDKAGIAMCAVDGFPIDGNEAEWAYNTTHEFGMIGEIILLDSNHEIRRARITSRDCYHAELLKQNTANLEENNQRFAELCDWVGRNRDYKCLKYHCVNTDNWRYDAEEDDKHYMPFNVALQSIWNFYNEKVEWQKKPTFERMMERVKAEVDEAIAAKDASSRCEELIDVLWFLLLACAAAGMDTWQKIFEQLMSKSRINQYRNQIGIKIDGRIMEGD